MFFFLKERHKIALVFLLNICFQLIFTEQNQEKWIYNQCSTVILQNKLPWRKIKNDNRTLLENSGLKTHTMFDEAWKKRVRFKKKPLRIFAIVKVSLNYIW